ARAALDDDALAIIVEVAADRPVPVHRVVLSEAVLDDPAHRPGLGDAHRHRQFAPGNTIALAAHRLEVHAIDRQRMPADAEIDFEAIATEYALVWLDAERGQLLRVQAVLRVGDRCVAGHAHELDRLAVRGFPARHHRHVYAAPV